ncbi:MAG TPA: ATP-grasp domain-containing protein, partial [Anaerovoracaceae bacterium]|nr:ATP-grasp domain-containing protein [Anaerovoracaceae bacterium]
GSSVGITKVKDRVGLRSALENAARYDCRLLVEEGIDCRELETAVLGNQNPKVSGVGEIIPSAEFYDYNAKYFDGGKSRLCIPADISDEKVKEIQDIALKAYKLLDCSGYARVDFFMEKSTGKILLNEINSIPGFTKYSMFPLLWGEAGIAYPDLIERIVKLGYERYNAKNSR